LAFSGMAFACTGLDGKYHKLMTPITRQRNLKSLTGIGYSFFHGVGSRIAGVAGPAWCREGVSRL